MQTPGCLIKTERNSAAPRPTCCNRRQFLGTITVTGLSLLPGCLSAEAATTFCGLLIGASREVALPPALGEAYLRQDDSEKEVEEISAALKDRIAMGHGAFSGLDSSKLLDRLGRSIGEDFAADESICRVQGWYFSQTECRLAALAYLLQERPVREGTNEAKKVGGAGRSSPQVGECDSSPP